MPNIQCIRLPGLYRYNRWVAFTLNDWQEISAVVTARTEDSARRKCLALL